MSVLKPFSDLLDSEGLFLGEGRAKSVWMKTETFESDISESGGIGSAEAVQVEGLQILAPI
jgi:hypothetical protein